MTATEDDVKRWVQEGKSRNATHMVSVCDQFSWDDYPVYVMPEDDLKDIVSKYDGPNMQKVNEVIDLERDVSTLFGSKCWKEEGIKRGAKYLIFAHDERIGKFPIYIPDGVDIDKMVEFYKDHMTGVIPLGK